jgi:predicted HicB family RNase H-like nuclease
MNELTYKTFRAAVVFDDEAGIYYGEVIGIRDVITFQANCRTDLQKAFEDSVEDYLAFCAAR